MTKDFQNIFNWWFFSLIFAVFNLVSHEIISHKINLSLTTKFKKKTRKSPKGKVRLYAENNISQTW